MHKTHSKCLIYFLIIAISFIAIQRAHCCWEQLLGLFLRNFFVWYSSKSVSHFASNLRELGFALR